jgi:hypothetical protein
MKWTLIMSMFRPLTVEHLERSLYSLSRQTVKPDEFLFFDNNSGHNANILAEISKHFTASDWTTYFVKHGNQNRTLSWANNRAIQLSNTDTFVFARADFIYDFRFCERVLLEHTNDPMSYATSWMWGMNYLDPNPPDLESFNWRENPQNLLKNDIGARPERASHQDGPTFCTSKKAMEAAGWYDETLVGWGFDQQDLQTQMMRNGVKMKVIPEFLYFHMDHPPGPEGRDPVKAKEIWLKSPRRLPEILAEEARLKTL